jgi:hypothetical protein
MQSLRSLLAAAAILASVGVASAAEPTTLTDEQLDSAVAGFFDNFVHFGNFLNLGGGGGGGAGGNSGQQGAGG